MADYKHMYLSLFHAVTDALEQLHTGDAIDAEYTLKKAQIACEDMFVESEPDINVVDSTKKIIEIHPEDRG